MSNGFSVYHHCQHKTRPTKETIAYIATPHHAPCSPPSENINVRGGLWFAHLKRSWQRPWQDTPGAAVYPSIEKGCCGAKAYWFYLHDSKYVSCLRRKPKYETTPYTKILPCSFPFYKGKNTAREIRKFKKSGGWQSKALYSLHITSAPFGPVVPTAARLVLTEHYWYPQTCKKILSAWHVIWRSRCQLTKAAYACMETKAPKWHPATAHAVHQSRKYLTRAGCCCLHLFVNLLMH